MSHTLVTSWIYLLTYYIEVAHDDNFKISKCGNLVTHESQGYDQGAYLCIICTGCQFVYGHNSGCWCFTCMAWDPIPERKYFLIWSFTFPEFIRKASGVLHCCVSPGAGNQHITPLGALPPQLCMCGCFSLAQLHICRGSTCTLNLQSHFPFLWKGKWLQRCSVYAQCVCAIHFGTESILLSSSILKWRTHVWISPMYPSLWDVSNEERTALLLSRRRWHAGVGSDCQKEVDVGWLVSNSSGASAPLACHLVCITPTHHPSDTPRRFSCIGYHLCRPEVKEKLKRGVERSTEEREERSNEVKTLRVWIFKGWQAKTKQTIQYQTNLARRPQSGQLSAALHGGCGIGNDAGENILWHPPCVTLPQKSLTVLTVLIFFPGVKKCFCFIWQLEYILQLPCCFLYFLFLVFKKLFY